MAGAAAAAAGAGGVLPLGVTLFPKPLSSTIGSGIGTQFISGGPVTPTVTGGTGSFSYNWTYVSGTAGLLTTAPSVANATFGANLNVGFSVAGVYRCTVTDLNTGFTASDDVSVTLTNTGP